MNYEELAKSLYTIREFVSKKEIDEALSLSARLVDEADHVEGFESDEKFDYFTFREFFEEVLYIYYTKPSKVAKRAEFPFAEVYLQHGSNLMECGRYEEAREILEKAKRWAPTNCDILFEYIETYKALGDMEKFASLTREAYKYAFHVEHMARCYRNMGYYFTEKEMYPEAIMCHVMSLEYDKKNEVSQREIAYINSKVEGKQLEFGTKEELEEKIGLSAEIFKQNVEIALAYGQHFLQQGEKSGAVYCLAIAYQMTGNEEIRKKIEEIQE